MLLKFLKRPPPRRRDISLKNPPRRVPRDIDSGSYQSDSSHGIVDGETDIPVCDEAPQRASGLICIITRYSSHRWWRSSPFYARGRHNRSLRHIVAMPSTVRCRWYLTENLFPLRALAFDRRLLEAAFYGSYIDRSLQFDMKTEI